MLLQYTPNLIKYALLILLFLLSIQIHANEKNPQEVIQGMMMSLEKDLLANSDNLKKDPELTSKILRKHIIPVVNFGIMSRYVLGKHWKKANKAEQQEFKDLFRQLLIRFYTKAFIEYVQTNKLRAGMIEFLPYREKKKSKHARIKTALRVSPESPKVAVNYSLYKGKKTGWKAYDINVEGISLVTTYRSSFDQIIKKSKMSGLLEHIQNKVDSIKIKNSAQPTSDTAKAN